MAMTQADINALIAKVNDGTYTIEEALAEIASAAKGADVRAGLFALAYLLNKEGKAGSTDLTARNQINTLASRLDNLTVNAATETYVSETLWEGKIGVAGDTVTLSSDYDGFDRVDVLYALFGNTEIRTLSPSSTELVIRGSNLWDDSSVASFQTTEIGLTFAGSTLTVNHATSWKWTGQSDAAATAAPATADDYAAGYIYAVIGYKVSQTTASIPELIDLRTAADGTTYESAGAAVRAQSSKLSEQIANLPSSGAGGITQVETDNILDGAVTPAKTTFFEKLEAESDFRANLFDSSDETNFGKIITDTSVGGTLKISANSVYNLSPFIPVEAGKIYTIQYNTTHTTVHVADKAYIVDVDNTVLNKSSPSTSGADALTTLSCQYPGLVAFTIEASENGYLVFGYRASTCSEIMVSEGQSIAEYVEFGVEGEKEYVYDFTPATKELVRSVVKDMGVGDVYYNCQDYDVIPDSEDNTDAMQSLIDLVNANGGGVIWIPVGTYRFNAKNSRALNSNIQACLEAKSYVSFLGESITGSVLAVYGDTNTGASLIASVSDNVTMGCTFQNFTVDLSEETMASYTHKGKAFHMCGIKDYVFRDLRLISTPSTALGIDMLDNVVIDSVYVYQGGRQWSQGGNGGAGIGIGTGKWENENYIIRNCICDSCGHFGIFLEDQGLFDTNKVQNFPKGQIITNNIIRNGRNYGIGLRGGQNVVISGNNLYENAGGLYVDYGAKDVLFAGNLVQGSTGSGFCYGDESSAVNGATYVCEEIVISGNTFFSNGIGIQTLLEPINSVEQNNVFIGNTTDYA